MNDAKTCETCGAPIPVDAPDGACPVCMLGGGLEEQSPFDRDALAEAFPQLEIGEVLGRGGMGVVCRARQKTLDRDVALKILPPELGKDAAFAERFTREARALAKLSHPNVVTVHEAGQAGDLLYLVMEFVEGVNLRQAQSAGRLDPAKALAIVPQICDALQYAHDHGVVHRDIKPENILIDRSGEVKIADFGLAKLLWPLPADTRLTGTEQVMGTFHYLAPEQIRTPKDVDHRADIYSLGVVFYEMLTGELPIGRFPRPSERVRVDVRLDDVVLRALERERDRRWAVKVAVHRLRSRYRELLRSEIEETVAGPEEVDAEIRDLMSALST
jgi:serine/threonine protein kinase